MNLILLSKSDFAGSGSIVRLTGRKYEHIRGVLKPSIGDELSVGLIGGKIGKGILTAIDGKSVEMDVLLKSDPPKPLPVILVLALPRPIVLKRLLGQITALGVKKIILINSNRVEKNYWKSLVLKRENIEEKLILGLEQAKDTVAPEVSLRHDFKKFAEDELPLLIKGKTAILADPEGGTTYPPPDREPITLVVGPEGGFIPDEVEKLKTAGCVPIRLGERVLRVETAVIAFIARFVI